MKESRIIAILFFFWGLCVHAQAQQDRLYIRQGNHYFKQQQYDKAEVEYRKAISQNAANPQAVYNLGCALLMQQKDSAAVVQYQNAGKMETNKLRKSQAFHNIGVICQGHQMYAEAIEAYKESLRNNPTDSQTRYNLALCKRLLKNQNQNNNSNSKDKNKEKKDDDKKQQNDKEKEKQKQDSNQQPKEQMSKENAEQLLNAAIQEEKATQQRLNKALQQPRKRQLQKNW